MHTSNKFSSRFYRPDKYLKPESGNMKIQQDVSNNNLHLNKVKNRVKDVETNRVIQQTQYDKPTASYQVAKKVDASNFETLRNQQLDSKRSNGSMRPSRGKEIAAVMMKQTAGEPNYFTSLDHQKNRADPTKAAGFDGTMTIISRNQGWITVTPKHKDRKKPVEKYGVSGDAAKTSKLTPNWMQCQYPKNKSDAMKSHIPKTTNLRAEQKRTYLVERNPPTQPPVEVHNIQAVSNNVTRMMAWNENPSKQRFDKPVAGKIGSYHG